MNRKEKSPFHTFTTGSWNAYMLIDYDPPGHLTCGRIYKGMNVFGNKYKVDVNVHPADQLIFWELDLEEKTTHTRTRRHSKGPPKRERKPPKAMKYKFAVNDEEGLLFCNKVIPNKLKEDLNMALHCRELQLLDLSSSDPINLLMFYKQSTKQSPGHLKLQYENKLASAADEVPQGAPLRGEDTRMNTTGSVIHQKLGCNHEEIPHIKKVTAAISNVPLKSEVDERSFLGPSLVLLFFFLHTCSVSHVSEVAPGIDIEKALFTHHHSLANAALEGFRVSEVQVEAYAPSVFHLYKELGELGIINDIPPWLEKMRTNGKTYCKAKYL
ncbi:uncharacterized protein [Panulirus ornatus]|uniref:uncharacterized protein isoform X1 n=1 Tax=Panulirus ornatus TaxID=150431 RepID=UPI003A8BF193